MRQSNILLTVLVIMLLTACSVEPRAIEYGTDQCAYCDMTVMDNRYGTEIVTEKGKVYTFDSIECLVNFLKKEMKEGEKAGLILVNTYTQPGKLVNAEGSWYLHSKELPSPMGMYLTAFPSKEELVQFKTEKGGVSYTWEELFLKFSTLKSSLLK